jgi:hypothetical protein
MPQLLAYGFACKRILQPLRGRERPRRRAASQRRLPSGERFVPGLRIVVPQPVHLVQTGHLALPVICVPLLDVCFVRRDQRSRTGESMCSTKYSKKRRHRISRWRSMIACFRGPTSRTRAPPADGLRCIVLLNSISSETQRGKFHDSASDSASDHPTGEGRITSRLLTRPSGRGPQNSGESGRAWLIGPGGFGRANYMKVYGSPLKAGCFRYARSRFNRRVAPHPMPLEEAAQRPLGASALRPSAARCVDRTALRPGAGLR